jgi:hypothetical protein
MRPWWQRRSLRLRLTLWYALTSTIILLALGTMLLFVVHRRLVFQLDRQLRADFETVESKVARDPAGNLHWLRAIESLENRFRDHAPRRRRRRVLDGDGAPPPRPRPGR